MIDLEAIKAEGNHAFYSDNPEVMVTFLGTRVPDLVAEVERLREELADQRAAYKSARDKPMVPHRPFRWRV
ncbi:MAG: hypothetical protein ACREMY_14755 [bacterium]